MRNFMNSNFIRKNPVIFLLLGAALLFCLFSYTFVIRGYFVSYDNPLVREVYEFRRSQARVGTIDITPLLQTHFPTDLPITEVLTKLEGAGFAIAKITDNRPVEEGYEYGYWCEKIIQNPWSPFEDKVGIFIFVNNERLGKISGTVVVQSL